MILFKQPFSKSKPIGQENDFEYDSVGDFGVGHYRKWFENIIHYNFRDDYDDYCESMWEEDYHKDDIYDLWLRI
jgi:6-phosphogluconate dehydrogenase (decarboxylating)